jgi:hypothetical protein
MARTGRGDSGLGRQVLRAAVFAAGLAPAAAGAEVTLSSANASTSIRAMSGVFDFDFAAAQVVTAAPGFTSFESDHAAAPPGPFHATATARQSASVDATADGVSARATGFARARAPLVPEPPNSNLFAEAASQVFIFADSTGPASFAISAHVSGATGSVTVTCFDQGGAVVEVLEQRSANVSGRIDGFGSCSVSVHADAIRNGNREFLAPGEHTSTFQMSFVMTELAPEDGDEFVWIGGPQGDFGDPANWDPNGVPTTDDTADFSRGRSAAVALSAAAVAAAASARAVPRGPAPVEILLERPRVNLDPKQPQAGVLRLLSPSFVDPSLVVNSGGRLLLDTGSVTAQNAVIGEDGLGTVEVTGQNLFQTDGILVLGRDGEGRLNVFSGGNALSDVVLLGAGSQPGNAIVSGNGSLWVASQLEVSISEPSTVQVLNGGEVDTTEAIVDRAPQGELPNVEIGENAKWLVDQLHVQGRGVVECIGGTIEPRNPLTPREIVIGNAPPGTARLLAGAGCDVRTAGDLFVGRIGDGRLEIEGADDFASVFADGLMRVGGASVDTGTVVVRSSINTQTDNLRAGSLEVLRGSVTLEHATRTAVAQTAVIGLPGSLVPATVALLGNGPPELTELDVEGNTRVAAQGVLRLRNAFFETGTLDVDAGGRIESEGDGSVIDAVSGILNNGVMGGRVRLAPGTFIASASTGLLLIEQFAAPSAASANPLLATSFARAVRAAPPPPPPLGGLLEFAGDGEIGGNLVLQFRNGFAPRAGEAIEVVQAGGALTGAFANVEVRGLAPGAQFDTSAASGALQLVALSDTVALPSVSLSAKPIVKEKQGKGGARVKFVRDGDTSAPLFVSYTIGGTAQNGIDFATLPGSVEIPAGKKSAKVLVRAFAEGQLEGPETIELEVQSGEGYTAGLPSRLVLELQSKDGVEKRKKPRRR